MSISKVANLVLVPSWGMGHLVPAIELAKHLVARDPRLSITVLLIKLPFPDDKLESHVLSLKSNPFLLNHGIKFLDMPMLDTINFDPASTKLGFTSLYMEAYQPEVKNVLEELQSEGPTPVAGILVDMFYSALIDVANELGLPSYVFFPSSAGFLRMLFNLQGLGIDVAEEYDVVRSPDTTMEIPGFSNPVPVKVWPGLILAKQQAPTNVLGHAKRYRTTKGILVNTFTDLERDLIHSMSVDNGIPHIYSVGPILNLAEDDHQSRDPIMTWLDTQPPRSVVFLCFGSRGSFNETQVKEIAAGLELTGKQFLWSLRRQPQSRNWIGPPPEFDDLSSVLPEGFLERTREQGRVIGWAPQAKVLAHQAVGAFVSHCGWNSTLESLWHGVPIAAWPVYSEQQLNAFFLVKELGLAAEIGIDYRQDFGIDMVVKAAEMEQGIKKAMEETTEMRKKVKQTSEKAKMAVSEGGSSYESLGQFIQAVFGNLP